MQGFLTRAFIIVLLAAGATLLGTGTASADTRCQQTNKSTGECILWVETGSPGGGAGGSGGEGKPAGSTSGPKDSGSGNSCYWDPAKQGVAGPPAGPVPCTSPYGTWSNDRNCYVEAYDPPPPPGDPAWEGHEPDDGAVYNCYQPQTSLLVTFWSQTPPEAAEAGPSPREVALMAIEKMNLRAIDIGITPEAGDDRVGLVGMPVWLWVNDPGPSTFGPATASASAGGITVSATARVHEITWDMGDGTQVVCRSAGTPYEPRFGKRKSPNCGHVYEKSSAHQRGEKYTVTATSDWVITWAGAGQTGTIRLGGLARSVDITVGEAQVLVS